MKCNSVSISNEAAIIMHAKSLLSPIYTLTFLSSLAISNGSLTDPVLSLQSAL